MNRALPLMSVTLATLLAGGVGCGESARTAPIKLTKPQPVVVNVVQATQTDLERTTTQPATVHAYYEARIFAKAAGYLTELKADIGTTVKKGDVLAVIGIPEMDKQREAKLAGIRRMQADERRVASQLAVSVASVAAYEARRDKAAAEVGASDAELAAAQVEFDRVTDLVNQRAVADRLLDEATKKRDSVAAIRQAAQAAVASADAELTLAQAQRDAAQADLDVAKAMTDVARRELDELDELIKYATLVAPFDGIVTQRHVDPGDLVRDAQTASGANGSPLFVIAEVDKVRIRVPIPERDAPLANAGDQASITLQALPGEVFEGQVARLAGVLDEMTRTMLVEIDLPNADGRLRPGMFGQATITLAEPGDALVLPANAVRFDEVGQSYVYVVDAADRIEIAQVATGLDSGEFIEIASGLNGDERIVGPLLRRLKAGQQVSVN